MANQVEALKYASGCIDEYKQELLNRIIELDSWRPLQAVALELVQKFPEAMAPDNSFHSPETRVMFTLDSGTHKALIISRDCKAVAEIVEPLRFLREKLGSYTVKDEPDLHRRVYTFMGGKVIFQAFFWNNADTVCRYVEVGKREVPVYKLMCDDKEVLEV